MSSIFLSHSSQDNEIAGHVKVRLVEQWGHQSVFLDFDPEDGIPAGRVWEKELYAKLRECRALIILCSQASMASRWCFAEITHAQALGKPVFPIKIDDVQVDRALTNVQIIDATAGWDAAYKRLEKGLLAAGLDPKDMFDWDNLRSPYPGLPAFEEQDAAIFFGRDKEIREGQALLNRLQQFGGPRLTVMLGASGSGKSSLMRAGLVPRLKLDKQRWIVIDPFRPLKAPFDELATVLSKWFSQVMQAERRTVPDVAHVRGRIRWEENQAVQSADTFLELLRELRESVGFQKATVLLMIDQCEELLAGGVNGEGDRFLAFLRAVLNREDSRLMVLATLRSDFLGSFQGHRTMRGLTFKPFTVPQMAVDDFGTVIEGPARVAGLKLGPGLVRAMKDDTKTSDALPLLAFTLRELYEKFGKKDKDLTLEEYRDELGGLDGCIAKAAEKALTDKSLSDKSLSEPQLSDLCTAFLSMVRVADNDQYAKQPVLWNDLLEKNLLVSTYDVLERFVAARLLVSSGDTNGSTLEVAHEALFRAWPRLAKWLQDNKSFLVWQQRLKAAMEEWEGSKRSSDLLLRGLPLMEAVEWLKKKPIDLSSVEWEFVTASKKQKAKNRIVAATIAGLVLTAISGTTWLWLKGYSLDQVIFKVQSQLLFMSIYREPEMQSVAARKFTQGDTQGRGSTDEKPLREVTIKSFKMGKFEVTFDEYDRFAIATGRDVHVTGDQGWGRERQPVINVSWSEAQAYAAWLSEKTKKHYRLPTESEWEYAARSEGKDDHLWAGAPTEEKLAEYAVYAANSQNRTAPVGPDQKRKPNAIGLYDMSGNVLEWVEDCWHGDYKDAPIDGSAWLEKNEGYCQGRVLRGGSWHLNPVNLRVSDRHMNIVDDRFNFIGFRLAQDIEP